MALDKLVDSSQLDSDLTSVANAIRAKSGGSGQLAFPAGFVSEIGNIPSGGGGGGTGYTLLASGSYTKTNTDQTLTIPVTYTGTPKIAVVEVETPLASTNQGISAGKYFVTSGDPAAIQSAVPDGMAHAWYQKTDGSHSSTNYGPGLIYFNSGKLCVARINATYLWQQNTYKWAIYGEAAT